MPKHQSLEQEKVYWEPCKEMGGSCLKNPKLSESFPHRKGEGREWLAAANFLVPDSLFLRSCQWCSYKSTLNKCYSPFWQERARSQGIAFTLWGPDPGLRGEVPAGPGTLPQNLHIPLGLGPPASAQVLAEEAGLSWQLPQGLVPRPCPAVIMEGARHLRPNWPSSSSGSWNGGGRASRAHARQTAAAFRSQRHGYRRDSPHLKAGPASGVPWRGLWSPTGHSPQPVSWTTQLTRWPKARWARGHREKAGIHLLPHSPPQDHSSADGWLNGSLTVALWQLFIVGGAQCKTDQWLSRTTNGHCWTVIRLGEGPTVEADQWKVRSNRQVC